MEWVPLRHALESRPVNVKVGHDEVAQRAGLVGGEPERDDRGFGGHRSLIFHGSDNVARCTTLYDPDSPVVLDVKHVYVLRRTKLSNPRNQAGMKTPKPLKPAGLRLSEEMLAELAVRAEAEQRSVGFLIRRYSVKDLIAPSGSTSRPRPAKRNVEQAVVYETASAVLFHPAKFLLFRADRLSLWPTIAEPYRGLVHGNGDEADDPGSQLGSALGQTTLNELSLRTA